ncbi:LysR family transcriptional regulator [Roseovarius pelagicus]|uniref:LysR substrate-binding domain-containing protein n=1 Tax=Roseovarius pelagicus TaxID=2980108 RepID=A0ABY6DBF6_9RHOB|nr:LysR substrate-binding domain-containing protein [Roseovarius pelagicus]UXX82905.1 LysR substrate-binding domain-containing protein [Roseovarius pelagicus]
MAIKIEMLRCFRTVADAGGLADAAEVLGRTPSAVSMMLRQFEDHIGAPLFESARKSHLTPLGAQIAAKAAQELGHFDRTVAAIEALARAEDGHVRLSVTPSVAQTIMPPILEHYMQARPGVRIEMRDTDSASVQRDLEQGKADIGIASLAPFPGFDRELILSDAFGVVCPIHHPLAQHWTDLGWDDLVSHAFIANGLCQQIRDPGFQPILHSSRLMVHNTASILSLVRAGAGITILPELAVLPKFMDLAFLPLADATTRREVWMVVPTHSTMTPATAALAAAIRSANVSPPPKFQKS